MEHKQIPKPRKTPCRQSSETCPTGGKGLKTNRGDRAALRRAATSIKCYSIRVPPPLASVKKTQVGIGLKKLHFDSRPGCSSFANHDPKRLLPRNLRYPTQANERRRLFRLRFRRLLQANEARSALAGLCPGHRNVQQPHQYPRTWLKAFIWWNGPLLANNGPSDYSTPSAQRTAHIRMHRNFRMGETK